jgi:hypothetical protein
MRHARHIPMSVSKTCVELSWSCGPHAPSQAETAAGGAAGGGPSPVRQTTVRCGRLGRGREFRCSASSCVHCTSAETPTSTQHCLQPCLKGKDGRGRKRSGQTGSDTVSAGQTRAPYPTPAPGSVTVTIENGRQTSASPPRHSVCTPAKSPMFHGIHSSGAAQMLAPHSLGFPMKVWVYLIGSKTGLHRLTTLKISSTTHPFISQSPLN